MRSVKHYAADWVKKRWGPSGASGMPMGLRLFLFLMVLVLTIVLGVVAILLMTGTFTAGLTESERLVENELLHTAQEISQQYGDLSVQAIQFSQELSHNIEEKSVELGISVSQLQDHPDKLEELIAAQFDHTYFFLQKSKSSGAFFVLDATVNPKLYQAENSKAGLYLKNMEPNILNASTPNIIVLRGFPSISRSNALSLHTQWRMEFDTSHAPYYHRPWEAVHTYRELPLSRLYYWSPPATLPGTSEEVMICSLPLLDSQGQPFGVCGFEVSGMFFKLSHMPKTGLYNRLFCVLAPLSASRLNLHQSMIAGGYSARIISRSNAPLLVTENNRGFYSYRQGENNSFWGLHTPVRLYPEGSAFAKERWVAAVMIPEQDVVSSVTRLNLTLLLLLLLLVILGIAASLVISRRYLQPISQGLATIKNADLREVPPTKVPEIDDLIRFLATRNEELYEGARQKNLSFSILDKFVKNVSKLSPAERSVYELYIQGYTAKEIADLQCLSINTIKTHSKHIYAKLNIASREELLLYMSLLEEINKDQ